MLDTFMYVVSPDYLLPLVEESKDYSFKVKGFSDCTRAYNNLITTNQSSILGYVLLYEEIPDDCTDIVEFINFLNVIGDKKTTVLFSVKNSDGFDQLLEYLEVDNIDFIYYVDFEVLTDLVIRRNLFGSILIKKFRPYKDIIKPLNMVTTYNDNKNLTPVLPSDILMILSPIIKFDTCQHTIDNDSVIKENEDNSLLRYTRVNKIRKLFGEEIDKEGMLLRIDKSEGIDKVLYKALCNMICKGY